MSRMAHKLHVDVDQVCRSAVDEDLSLNFTFSWPASIYQLETRISYVSVVVEPGGKIAVYMQSCGNIPSSHPADVHICSCEPETEMDSSPSRQEPVLFTKAEPPSNGLATSLRPSAMHTRVLLSIEGDFHNRNSCIQNRMIRSASS